MFPTCSYMFKLLDFPMEFGLSLHTCNVNTCCNVAVSSHSVPSTQSPNFHPASMWVLFIDYKHIQVCQICRYDPPQSTPAWPDLTVSVYCYTAIPGRQCDLTANWNRIELSFHAFSLFWGIMSPWSCQAVQTQDLLAGPLLWKRGQSTSSTSVITDTLRWPLL